MSKTKLFIDVSPLVDPHPSGIAHSIAGLVGELSKISKNRQYEVVLLVPRKNAERLKRWPDLARLKQKKYPFRTRVLNLLNKYNLLPPMDIFFGRGVYLFGNFKNWPLTGFSRSLTFVHDICFALFPEFVQPKNQRMLIEQVPKYIKRTNKVITVSETSKKEITDYYRIPGMSVGVVYNGVDTALYKKHSQKLIDTLKKKIGVAGKYFIFLGNIEPRKNLNVLIDAFNELPMGLKDTTSLVIIGSDGWLNDNVLKAIDVAKKNGVNVVRPSGYIEDEEVSILLAGSVALVQPSFHEGFSMPPVEALAAGTQVIASKIPVHQEILGDKAQYFNPSSKRELSRLLEGALSGSVQKELDSSFLDRYSWSNSAEVLFEYIDEVKELRKIKYVISKEGKL